MVFTAQATLVKIEEVVMMEVITQVNSPTYLTQRLLSLPATLKTGLNLL